MDGELSKFGEKATVQVKGILAVYPIKDVQNRANTIRTLNNERNRAENDMEIEPNGEIGERV